MIDFDAVIDYFVDHNDIELSVLLLKTIAHEEQGGNGYKLVSYASWTDIEGYDVDHSKKLIYLYAKGFWVGRLNSVKDVSDNLKTALEVAIAHSRSSLTARIGWGTGEVLLGVVELGTGLVGIIIPLLGTTVAGIVVVALGTNNIMDSRSLRVLIGVKDITS